MADKHFHLAFGRMNPITKGHEQVVDQVVNSAEKDDGGHTIVLTKSHDAKKNPLSPEQKLKHAKRAFPDANFKVADSESPTLLHHASNLYNQGVTHLTVHVGSDRVDNFHKLLHDYNGKESKHGYFNFKKIKVQPVGGERDDNAEGAAGASGTAMRKLASSGNLSGFKEMAPTAMSDKHKEEMYHDVRNGMNISESAFKSFKQWLLAEITNTVVGTGVRGLGDVTGTPAGDITNYAAHNAAQPPAAQSLMSQHNAMHMGVAAVQAGMDADTKDNVLKKKR